MRRQKPPYLLQAREHHARYHYHCDDCGAEIEPGERYEHSVWVVDDGLEREWRCADCAELEATG